MYYVLFTITYYVKGNCTVARVECLSNQKKNRLLIRVIFFHYTLEGNSKENWVGLCRLLPETLTLFTIIIVIIVLITKFSIVIGSPPAYLSHNRRAITWVSDLNFL